jgi:clorobiocin biosynthesis protein Clo-hal
VLPVLDELGLSEEILRHGFVKKYGVTLSWGRHREPWTVHFDETGPFDHTYQVVRSEFDHLLLRNARGLGATVLEETRAEEFIFRDGRCVGVECAPAGAPRLRVRARFVVDASGQSALLARKLGLLEWDEGLKNVAVWAYYQGGATLLGKDAGNILVENMPHGWLWVIPLHDGTHSVGWVTQASGVHGRADLERSLENGIASSKETRRLLGSARRVSGFRTARDWSYRSSRFHGQGFLLAGDAAGFVDPLFSTGVFLAMNAASLAARIVRSILEHPEREAELLMRYDETYGSFIGVVFSFVHYFYDASRDKEAYWARAQELVDPRQEMATRHDFLRLISGLHGIQRVLELSEAEGLAGEPAAVPA